MREHAYRAYVVGKDGQIIGRRDLLSCQDDEAAKAYVERLVDGHAVELWDGACLLARFEPMKQ
jgi:hypothetical protein